MIQLVGMLSVVLVFLGGAAFGLNHPMIAVASTALGAGWLGILFATLQRIAADAVANLRKINDVE